MRNGKEKKRRYRSGKGRWELGSDLYFPKVRRASFT
jgi:hypothetical protein